MTAAISIGSPADNAGAVDDRPTVLGFTVDAGLLL